MLVAVCAADPVDVMGALRICKTRIHLFDVDAAVGHLRMAGLAGGGSVLTVASVAGETADSLVNSDGRAVVARSDLGAPVICGSDGGRVRLARRMALIAERLTLVGTDLHGTCTV